MKVVLALALLALVVAEETAPTYGITTEPSPAFTAPDELVAGPEELEGMFAEIILREPQGLWSCSQAQ